MHSMDQADVIAFLKAFHGHLGPYVLAGLRVGRYAVEQLGARAHFGIEADIDCPDRPPPSCFIDGIQFSTGCTMGKMNIRHHTAEGVTARFRNRDTGQRLAVRLRQEAVEQAIAEMRANGDEAGAGVIAQMADDALFEVLACQ